MLRYVATDLFQSPAQVLVNTVNTVGVMGKGVAKEFASIYPDMYTKYRALCERHLFDIGQLWLYKTSHKWILNFPTKRHWRSPSKVEYIEAGLKKFVDTYAQKGITSISFPLLGCGNGGLDFDSQVQPVMEKYLQPLPIDVFVHLTQKFNKSEAEHLKPAEMKRWLRSNPSILSFSEFWADIIELVQNGKEIVYKNSHYLVTVNKTDDGGLHFQVRDNGFIVSEDQFMALWTHLRSVGFTWQQELPAGLHQVYGPLFTLLQCLPYIERIGIDFRYPISNDSQSGIRIVPHRIVPTRRVEEQVIH
ncbi:macro domain-containing protein [Kyrpidia spormannii]|uniref:Uncharacterized protein n=2 Tax=Kyrpidia spormannii TaxID=2055160 RepID=A0ACA8ZE69_9BACL|nr:macro domain-containing protein [Kyrpidia spormannii]CAB3395716.1 protein of unknown function [Kyrpidia spormannii]CAB3396284.1 protein of unknown function [Kyrpidia spormannii]